uniref:Uncharacterized protein n=1 Tax=Syphacia muris TaxID=451379 RepID=A0A0N5AZ65_9BILA
MPTAEYPNGQVTPLTGHLKTRKKGPLGTSTPITRLHIPANKVQLPSTAKDCPNISLESSHDEHSVDYGNGKNALDASDDLNSKEGRYNLRQRLKNENIAGSWLGDELFTQDKNNVKEELKVSKLNKKQPAKNASATRTNGHKRYSYETSPSLSEISPVVSPEQRVSSLLDGQRNRAKYEPLGTTDFYPEPNELNVSMFGRKFFVKWPAVMYCLHCLICVTMRFGSAISMNVRIIVKSTLENLETLEKKLFGANFVWVLKGFWEMRIFQQICMKSPVSLIDLDGSVVLCWNYYNQ